MTRDEVLAKLRAHEAELRAAGVEALRLFGSVARDEARVDSDVDLMIDGASRLSLFDIMDVRDRCVMIVGRKVDLGERSAMRPRVRKRIDPETGQVF